jgi:hypothetical protein
MPSATTYCLRLLTKLGFAYVTTQASDIRSMFSCILLHVLGNAQFRRPSWRVDVDAAPVVLVLDVAAVARVGS